MHKTSAWDGDVFPRSPCQKGQGVDAVKSIWCPRGSATHTAPEADLTVLSTESEALTVCMAAAKKSRAVETGRFHN